MEFVRGLGWVVGLGVWDCWRDLFGLLFFGVGVEVIVFRESF